MNLVRKYLLWLRKELYNDRMFFFIKLFSAAFAMAAVAFITDKYVPIGPYWNLIRTFELIPASISFFNIIYVLGVLISTNRLRNDDTYTPLRMRFSYAWRLRISAILGTLLLVIIFATKEGPTYTFTSSIIGAVILILITFIRPTAPESQRSQLGIPDLRDIRFELDEKKIKNQKKKLKEKKKEERKSFKLTRF